MKLHKLHLIYTTAPFLVLWLCLMLFYAGDVALIATTNTETKHNNVPTNLCFIVSVVALADLVFSTKKIKNK